MIELLYVTEIQKNTVHYSLKMTTIGANKNVNQKKSISIYKIKDRKVNQIKNEEI